MTKSHHILNYSNNRIDSHNNQHHQQQQQQIMGVSSISNHCMYPNAPNATSNHHVIGNLNNFDFDINSASFYNNLTNLNLNSDDNDNYDNFYDYHQHYQQTSNNNSNSFLYLNQFNPNNQFDMISDPYYMNANNQCELLENDEEDMMHSCANQAQNNSDYLLDELFVNLINSTKNTSTANTSVYSSSSKNYRKNSNQSRNMIMNSSNNCMMSGIRTNTNISPKKKLSGSNLRNLNVAATSSTTSTSKANRPYSYYLATNFHPLDLSANQTISPPTETLKDAQIQPSEASNSNFIDKLKRKKSFKKSKQSPILQTNQAEPLNSANDISINDKKRKKRNRLSRSLGDIIKTTNGSSKEKTSSISNHPNEEVASKLKAPVNRSNSTSLKNKSLTQLTTIRNNSDSNYDEPPYEDEDEINDDCIKQEVETGSYFKRATNVSSTMPRRLFNYLNNSSNKIPSQYPTKEMAQESINNKNDVKNRSNSRLNRFVRKIFRGNNSNSTASATDGNQTSSNFAEESNSLQQAQSVQVNNGSTAIGASNSKFKRIFGSFRSTSLNKSTTLTTSKQNSEPLKIKVKEMIISDPMPLKLPPINMNIEKNHKSADSVTEEIDDDKKLQDTHYDQETAEYESENTTNSATPNQLLPNIYLESLMSFKNNEHNHLLNQNISNNSTNTSQMSSNENDTGNDALNSSQCLSSSNNEPMTTSSQQPSPSSSSTPPYTTSTTSSISSSASNNLVDDKKQNLNTQDHIHNVPNVQEVLNRSRIVMSIVEEINNKTKLVNESNLKMNLKKPIASSAITTAKSNSTSSFSSQSTSSCDYQNRTEEQTTFATVTQLSKVANHQASNRLAQASQLTNVTITTTTNNNSNQNYLIDDIPFIDEEQDDNSVLAAMPSSSSPSSSSSSSSTVSSTLHSASCFNYNNTCVNDDEAEDLITCKTTASVAALSATSAFSFSISKATCNTATCNTLTTSSNSGMNSHLISLASKGDGCSVIGNMTNNNIISTSSSDRTTIDSKMIKKLRDKYCNTMDSLSSSSKSNANTISSSSSTSCTSRSQIDNKLKSALYDMTQSSKISIITENNSFSTNMKMRLLIENLNEEMFEELANDCLKDHVHANSDDNSECDYEELPYENSSKQLENKCEDESSYQEGKKNHLMIEKKVFKKLNLLVELTNELSKYVSDDEKSIEKIREIACQHINKKFKNWIYDLSVFDSLN